MASHAESAYRQVQRTTKDTRVSRSNPSQNPPAQGSNGSYAAHAGNLNSAGSQVRLPSQVVKVGRRQ